jgi:hypothetical protein
MTALSFYIYQNEILKDDYEEDEFLENNFDRFTNDYDKAN